MITLGEQLIREGKQQGLLEGKVATAREAVLEVLDARFREVPGPFRHRIGEIEDLPALRELLKVAATAESMDRFREALERAAGPPSG